LQGEQKRKIKNRQRRNERLGEKRSGIKKAGGGVKDVKNKNNEYHVLREHGCVIKTAAGRITLAEMGEESPRAKKWRAKRLSLNEVINLQKGAFWTGKENEQWGSLPKERTPCR